MLRTWISVSPVERRTKMLHSDLVVAAVEFGVMRYGFVAYCSVKWYGIIWAWTFYGFTSYCKTRHASISTTVPTSGKTKDIDVIQLKEGLHRIRGIVSGEPQPTCMMIEAIKINLSQSAVAFEVLTVVQYIYTRVI